MTDHPDTFERIGGAAGLVAIAVGVTKLGFIRWIKTRWSRRAERDERLTKAVESVALSINGIRDEMQRVSAALRAVSQSSSIAGAIARMALDHSDKAMWETDGEGECIWVNKACAALFGMPVDRMRGRGWTRAIAAGHGQRAWDEFKTALDRGVPYRSKYPIEAGGELINVVASGEVLTDQDGRVIHVFGTVERIKDVA